MLASALVGAACDGLARAAQPVADAWPVLSANRIYEGALPVLRLPPALVPRRPPER